jgi:hypothetical protein
MSASDTPDQDVLASAAGLDRIALAGNVQPASVQAAVSAVTRLYANAVEQAGAEIRPLDPSVSTTDALTLACALLRSQDLTPFDMALWFNRAQGIQK